ncbi:PREDICTED: protein HAPLESS 2 isoform X2 [Nelumbo nucifera]|uniref:Protein HAPLESS 2 isoform X2 n=1 Tax=Nelumbo nucifera TaxID=4432 RepID=A0A1U8BB56_NELNU|nr:PREDICTED: protein HAPLESS 2 isoform X2 [Nelumbo nucifera]
MEIFFFIKIKEKKEMETRLGVRPFCLIFFFLFLSIELVIGVQILAKSKLEKCERTSDSVRLNCNKKIIVNMAVPSGSSGREASIVAEIVEVEENATNKMQALRIPPVVTVNKSAAYALYEITYIRDVPYKPEEYYVKTRKCEPNAGSKVVKICERLRDENGHIIEHTQPICCPCGTRRRVPSSCGSFFGKLMKGKANTAHCLRFPGDWFHVFGIGRRLLGFSVHIKVKTGSKISEVVVGPENRTVLSNDNFLRVNLIGDFVGYTSIPSFEDFYLVIPRQGGPGQPQNLGRNFSMWMLLERVRFTLDGLECNKIGVSYEAYNGQPNFCASPFRSCLHNQLWNFWEADQNRVRRNQMPLYGVEGRFERINEHPDAGPHSFSIGITEVLNSNLLIELSADDIEYVYQSPGKILSVTIPTFEALTQFGIATITVKNIGKLEASYSLTFDCSKGITLMEEQFFIMKPEEIAVRSFKLYPTTDQAAKYICAAILKDSDFNEVDRAECQFTTTATVLDNGSQITPFQPPKTGIHGFFESIKSMWKKMWDGMGDFFTGRTCRRKCSGFFDFSCHIQYICMTWILMFGLLLAIFPTVVVLLWLLHQKGLFDPIYDWWDDRAKAGKRRDYFDPKYRTDVGRSQIRLHRYHKQEGRHHAHHEPRKHSHIESGTDYYHLYHPHKDRHKHGGKSDPYPKRSRDGNLFGPLAAGFLIHAFRWKTAGARGTNKAFFKGLLCSRPLP